MNTPILEGIRKEAGIKDLLRQAFKKSVFLRGDPASRANVLKKMFGSKYVLGSSNPKQPLSLMNKRFFVPGDPAGRTDSIASRVKELFGGGV